MKKKSKTAMQIVKKKIKMRIKDMAKKKKKKNTIKKTTRSKKKEVSQQNGSFY